MKVFDAYAQYYDLLYQDKEYAAEAAFVHRLIQQYYGEAQTLLDMGCGTGRHSRLFAQQGYHVVGVDRSEKMIKAACAYEEEDHGSTGSLSFQQGDIRTLQLNRRFDVIVALFHVISYQTSNDGLRSTFKTIQTHLNAGGLLIFDCWYGPTVLTDRPSVRIKRLKNESIEVTRIAEPVIHSNENVVDVNYHMYVRHKADQRVNELEEVHRMRYLFRPEVDQLLEASGMQCLTAGEWMTSRPPGMDTWSVFFVSKSKR